MESLSPSMLLGVKQPQLNTDRIWDFEASLVSSREAAPALLSCSASRQQTGTGELNRGGGTGEMSAKVSRSELQGAPGQKMVL